MDDKFVLRDSAEVVNRKLDLLLRTGCLLMECSADTTRIMRTLKRTIAYLGLRSEHLHLYVNYTILMVNYHDDTHSYTNFRHCKKHIIDMAVISEVSRLSWRSIAEDMTLDEYEAVLSELGMKRNRYTPWLCLWWFLHSVWMRLGLVFLCIYRRYLGLSIENVFGKARHECVCRHGHLGLCGHHDCMAFLVVVGRFVGRLYASVPPFGHTLASVVGLCALHRARCAAH